MKIATAIEITTQIEAILLEVLTMFLSPIAMKRRRICGIPKYPSPHARSEAIVRSEYLSEPPVSRLCIWVSEKYPEIFFALSTTSPKPPAVWIPKQTMLMRASVITIL